MISESHRCEYMKNRSWHVSCLQSLVMTSGRGGGAVGVISRKDALHGSEDLLGRDGTRLPGEHMGFLPYPFSPGSCSSESDSLVVLPAWLGIEALTLSADGNQFNLLTSWSYLPPATPPQEVKMKPPCESRHDGSFSNWRLTGTRIRTGHEQATGAAAQHHHGLLWRTTWATPQSHLDL